jgi:hypothetical protein
MHPPDMPPFFLLKFLIRDRALPCEGIASLFYFQKKDPFYVGQVWLSTNLSLIGLWLL